MPADRIPDAGIPPIGRDGNFAPVWWRFFARIGSQFSGEDVPLMPVDAAGVLSVASAQPKPHSLSEGQIQEIAQQVLGLLPRVAPKSGETADNALISLGKGMAPSGSDLQARELAAVAMSRIQPQKQPQPPQIVFCTQATFPASNTLWPNTLIVVTDYAHTILWNGAAFSFMDGGSDYYVVAPSAPAGIGWHAVDGSPVNYLNADGTVTAKTLRNVAGTPAYLKVGAGADTLNAPTAPTISGHTEVASAVLPAVLTGIGFAQPTGSTGNDALTGQVVQSGAGVTVAAHPHTHPTAATVTDSGHQHTVTVADTGHQHNLTSANAPISTTGEPENFYSQLWFRL